LDLVSCADTDAEGSAAKPDEDDWSRHLPVGLNLLGVDPHR
jgi:hypothetical protein